MYTIWLTVFLFICSITDIKVQKVYLLPCILNFGAIVLARLWERNLTLKDVLGTGVIFIALAITSIVSKNNFGMGDSLVVGISSLMIGVQNAVKILFLGLIICILFFVVARIIKKVNSKTVIPFVPFLFLGNMILMMLGGGFL